MTYQQHTHKNQPTILLLDSGLGGLSIYTAIKKILPYAHYLYFFDNKAFPYGDHSSKFIANRVIYIVKTLWNLYQFELLIIACNTASIITLKILRKKFPFPIVGVIPAIQLASKNTRNKIIGILATNRTISHLLNWRSIKKLEKQYKFMLLGSSELVNEAESKIYGKKMNILKFYQILLPWLKSQQFPDTIILGCTHFSLLKKELTKILPKNSHLIESTQSVINHSIHLLHRKYSNFTTDTSKILIKKNKVCCSLYTPKIKILKSILLLQYNFFSLEILPI